MKYLKLFQTESEYNSFKDSSDFVLPNVSHIKEFAGLPHNDSKRPVMFNKKPIKPASSYVAVDLGLPSGRLWADRNVGAESPDDVGLYFQWGDTTGYTLEQYKNNEKKFDWTTYWDSIDGSSTNFTKYPYTYNKKIILPEDDAAVVIMGGSWRMPSEEDFEELINNTTSVFVTDSGKEVSYSFSNDIMYLKLTSKINGNNLIIPAGGQIASYGIDSYKKLTKLWVNNTSANYPDNGVSFSVDNMHNMQAGNSKKSIGMPIRGVCN